MFRNDLADFSHVGHRKPSEYSEKTILLGSALRADILAKRADAKAVKVAKCLKGFTPLTLDSFI